MTVAEQRRAVFSLASSLEDGLEALQGGFDGLLDAPGIAAVGCSSVYETVPVGDREQADLLTAVLVADTVLPSALLLERAHGVQAAMHRDRDGTREVIDVDLVSVGSETGEDPLLRLPHPRAHQRAWVLVPWHEVDPAGWLPGSGAVGDLVAAVADQDLWPREDLQLRPPT